MSTSFQTSTEQYLRLPDGRRLCYAEYGDPDGSPIFVFHGNPGSRLGWLSILKAGVPAGIRLIAPDRPGYGRTDFVEGVTTVTNWPNDVAALADALDLDRFAVFGPSGGGPYALACAWLIPERLTAVGVFASVGPFNAETDRNINPIVRSLWTQGSKVPRILRVQMRAFGWLAKRAPGLYVRMILREFSDIDRADYDRLGVADRIRNDRHEAYRQHGIGTWYDMLLPVDWPIPLRDIEIPVRLWHGREDTSAPLAMGEYLAREIQDCESTFIDGVGHFWIFDHLSELLEELAVSGDG